MRGIPHIFLLIILCLGLSGCSGGYAQADAGKLAYPSPTAFDWRTFVSTPLPITATERFGFTITPSPLPPLILKETPKPPRICSPLSSTPVDELQNIVSDGYHPPPEGQDGRHQGVDFAYYRKDGRLSIEGELVQSVFEGQVAGLILDRYPYGNAVIVETMVHQIPLQLKEKLDLTEGESVYVLYAHLAEVKISRLGEQIESCQPLGSVGKSGNAGVAHLHLEARIGGSGQIIQSMAYYVAEADPAEREMYLIWRTSGQFQHFDPMELFLFSE